MERNKKKSKSVGAKSPQKGEKGPKVEKNQGEKEKSAEEKLVAQTKAVDKLVAKARGEGSKKKLPDPEVSQPSKEPDPEVSQPAEEEKNESESKKAGRKGGQTTPPPPDSGDDVSDDDDSVDENKHDLGEDGDEETGETREPEEDEPSLSVVETDEPLLLDELTALNEDVTSQEVGSGGIKIYLMMAGKEDAGPNKWDRVAWGSWKDVRKTFKKIVAIPTLERFSKKAGKLISGKKYRLTGLKEGNDATVIPLRFSTKDGKAQTAAKWKELLKKQEQSTSPGSTKKKTKAKKKEEDEE